jgi:hypothetical protein
LTLSRWQGCCGAWSVGSSVVVIDCGRSSGMLVELRVGEQRCRAVWHPLDPNQRPRIKRAMVRTYSGHYRRQESRRLPV